MKNQIMVRKKLRPYISWHKNKVLFLLLILIVNFSAKAQFTLRDALTGSSTDPSSHLVFGGAPAAFLTSGNLDPINQGWLRLTTDSVNQKGYAYINEAFPSSLGVFIDFEFKTWRTHADNVYNGADGISVFLFNADSTFRIGGWAGSLGYAGIKTNGYAYQQGLAGGYFGLGIDEEGSYSNPNDGGKVGGAGQVPNSIALRGATTDDSATSNPYIAGAQISGNSTTTFNGVDYNTITKTRPTGSQFYRRVQIRFIPTPDSSQGKFHIIVKLDTTLGGSFFTILDTYTNQAPPKNLKLGFAAATGGGFNIHEMRNLYVTTPGGVRVNKTVDQTSAQVGSHLKYKINVYNSTPAKLSNLNIYDTLKDGNGNIMSSNNVRIDSIRFNNNGDTANVVTSNPSNNNPFIATMRIDSSKLSGDAVGTFTVYTTVLQPPSGNIVTNTVRIDPSETGITDADMTNNVDSVSTNIIVTDLSLSQTHSGSTAPKKGDTTTFTLNVMNNGPSATGSTATISDTIPSGMNVNLDSIKGNGWVNITQNGNIITAQYNGPINSASTYPPLSIQFVDTSSVPAGTLFINKAGITISTDNDLSNNTSRDTVYASATLPITLQSFTGKRENGANILNWTTASEINLKRFNIQRSTDNNTWTTIGSVNADGDGTSSTPNSYQFTDVSGAYYKTAYYKLYIVNLDSSSSYVGFVAITGNVNNNVVIYPNPAKSNVTIKGIDGNIKIFDASGRQVISTQANAGGTSIPVSQLASGIYFIQSNTGKYKFIKQ